MFIEAAKLFYLSIDRSLKLKISDWRTYSCSRLPGMGGSVGLEYRNALSAAKPAVSYRKINVLPSILWHWVSCYWIPDGHHSKANWYILLSYWKTNLAGSFSSFFFSRPN